jgi:hypothetical protein
MVWLQLTETTVWPASMNTKSAQGSEKGSFQLESEDKGERRRNRSITTHLSKSNLKIFEKQNVFSKIC